MRGGGTEMARKFLKDCAKHMRPIVYVQKQITRNVYYMLREMYGGVMAMILIHCNSTKRICMHCMTDNRNSTKMYRPIQYFKQHLNKL